ncbi:Fic family protein [Craterilacuibacter sp.]|uniref:Fic family protein n=1 Tax=Craterilacuibacter sp. TaxID=2870909 RepID=UPI003F2DAE06
MANKKMEFYDHPAQMEPMLIEDSRPAFSELVGWAHELCQASTRLDAVINKHTARSLSELVSGMNCYYSNLIEGHKTLPIDISKTLQEAHPLGADRDHQSLARAHIEADRWAKSQELSQANLRYFLSEVHRLFCEYLPDEMLVLPDHSVMTGGVFRKRDVQVGRHLSPKWEYLDDFLNRYIEVYGRRMEWAKNGGVSKLISIVAAFAAHHRLVWIHPFLDGNGRVARIALDAMLRASGINGTALWSMSRGLAKNADKYKAQLAQADEHRHGDLDGRGNLTERGLAQFCLFGLQTGIDQATFMADMFDLDNFKDRVHFYFENIRSTMLRPESAYLYMQAFTMGEFERGEAPRLTGLHERTARDVLGKLVKEGFLVSDTPKGKVRVGFPMQAMSFLLPNLYPHGDIDFSDQTLRVLHTKINS